MKISTLILDDDPHWRTIIQKIVERTPLLYLVKTCSSVMDTYQVLTDRDIDLIICDIEMPDMSGLSFIRSLSKPPLVIFLTAHSSFTLDSYDVSAVDYLLKPVEYGRFLQSIEKVRQRLLPHLEAKTIDPYFIIRESLSYVQIACKDVIFMKAQDNQLHILTTTQTFIPILTIAKIEEQIKNDLFLRVHRSYMINRSFIRLIGREEIVLTTGHIIPIGNQYRNDIVHKHIEKNLISRIG